MEENWYSKAMWNWKVFIMSNFLPTGDCTAGLLLTNEIYFYFGDSKGTIHGVNRRKHDNNHKATC